MPRHKFPSAALLLLPTGLWLLVFLLTPLLILFVYSLGSRDPLGRVQLGFNFVNYTRFFSMPYFWTLGRSMIYLLISRNFFCNLARFQGAEKQTAVFHDSACGTALDFISFAHLCVDDNS
jgi:ABC-type sugar transport system permease subunit